MRKILFVMLSVFALALNAQNSVYDFKVADLEENTVSLDAYKGKVLLIVNTATKCGFTPQYKELQEIYDKYHAQGFEVLDFPCNQFGEQAPGSNEEIHKFCTDNYETTFPQFSKIDVNGENESPLFTFLKAKQGFKGFPGERGQMMEQMMARRDPDFAKKSDIKWNFTKFLVNKNGEVIARFEPTMDMAEVEAQVKAQL
ncbi:MAG: glutathione peroxidase [Bacteroidaceae bacterium]|nr:glutathione peroxidase [Bacteroidaceae bacterium]MBQ9883123.1 glutathione peroxidase [Bacteroidaceae bacterium]